MPTIGSRKRARTPDLQSLVGWSPTITPQATAGTSGVSTPAAPSKINASTQLGVALTKLGGKFSDHFKTGLKQMTKEGLEQGSSMADIIASTRKDWASALKEAEKKGLLHNGENPYVKQGMMIRMGQRFAASPEFKASLRGGMEDAITSQLATDGRFPDWEAFRTARLSEAMLAGLGQLPDSNFARNLGFAPIAAQLVAKEGEVWDNYYKEAVSIKNEEVIAGILHDFFDGNLDKEGVNFYGGAEVTEGYAPSGWDQGWGYELATAPYNSMRPTTKSREFLYKAKTGQILGTLKPTTSILHAQSLREAVANFKMFRGIIEPNSKARVDSGEMKATYVKFGMQLQEMLDAAERGEASRMSAVKKKAQTYWQNFATFHYLREGPKKDPDGSYVDPPQLIEDPTNFREFMERAMVGEIIDIEKEAIGWYPKGHPDAHPIWAPDPDVYEYSQHKQNNMFGMLDAVTAINTQVNGKKINTKTILDAKQKIFDGQYAELANTFIRDLTTLQIQGKLKIDDRLLEPYLSDLQRLMSSGKDLLGDAALNQGEIALNLMTMAKSLFPDSKIDRPQPNVAETYAKVYEPDMLQTLLDGGEALQRSTFASWGIGQEFQDRLVGMLRTKNKDISDLLTFEQGTEATKYTSLMLSKTMRLQHGLGGFVQAELGELFRGAPAKMMFGKSEAYSMLHVAATQFLTTDYIPLVEKLLQAHNNDVDKVKRTLNRLDGPLWKMFAGPVTLHGTVDPDTVTDENPEGKPYEIPNSLLYKFHVLGYDSDFDGSFPPKKGHGDADDYQGGWAERIKRMMRFDRGLSGPPEGLLPHKRTKEGRPGL